MSFADWSNKKKKKEEEEKKSATSSTSLENSFEQWSNDKLGVKDEYFEYRKKLSAEKDDDIAPVAEKKERTWFDTSVFDDGYQLWDISKAILGSGEDLAKNIGAGLIGIGEQAVDAFATVAPYMASGMYYANGGGYNPQTDAAFKQMTDSAKDLAADFVSRDLYDEQKVAEFIVDHSLMGQSNKMLGIDSNTHSIFGEKSDALAQSGGQLLGQLAVSAIPGIGQVGGMALMGVTAFGSEAEGALQNGATLDEAAFSGAVSAGAEILTEKLGGISFGGKTLTDAMFSKLSRNMTSKLAKILITTGKVTADALAEGGEEILSGYMSAIGQKMSYMSDKEIEELFSKEDRMESFIGGLVLGGMGGGVDAVKSTIQGVDPVSGLNKNEKAVVDKEYNNRLAERESNGEKLTAREKNKLYDTVVKDMEKGIISTDTIEEVLGDRSSYDALSKEAEEYDTLYNTPSGQLSKAQQDRLAELDSKNKANPYKDAMNVAKDQYSQSVFELVKGDRLAESYNERTRRGQAFEADLTQYDAKQQAVVQKAIDSGILNNTNRTHEFVDIIAKISADKGVPFDFTNNAKLKDSGFAVDGKTVNGYVTKDGITINIDSSKAWQSTVGHEITHVLEGTDMYDALKQTLFDYAKSKGEYDSRLSALTETYKSVKDADIDAELAADLVGDYLFTDSDFIHRLSTENRNVFQKIYDEIKYLYKVATAGSKEARELEKVKKAFEDAYRANVKGKAQSGTKHSISEGSRHKEELEKRKESITDEYVRLMESADQYWFDLFGEWLNPATEDITTSYIREMVNHSGSDRTRTGQKLLELADAIDRVNSQMDELTNRINVQASANYTDDSTEDHKETDIATRIREVNSELGSTMTRLNNTSQYINGVQKLWQQLANREITSEQLIAELRKDTRYKELDDKANALREQFDSLVKELETVTGKKWKELRRETLYPSKTKYSVSDSDGKQLTKEQQEYFKDSKVRDENGNLLKVYHGTPKSFTTFKQSKADGWGTGMYFTDNRAEAENYGENIVEAYLNITNPFDADTMSYYDIGAEDTKAYQDFDRKLWQNGYSEYDSYEEYKADGMGADMYDIYTEEVEVFNKILRELGYDGIIADGSNGIDGKEIVAFKENQAKLTTNAKPTGDPDIRYSLSEDSNGKKLSAEQSEFFKDSKAVDANGNLQIVYHGTRNADFTVFKRNVNFFTDSKEMADSYSPNGAMYEGYVNITKPYEIDAQGEKWSKIPIDAATKNFLQEYGASVFKEGGKWRTTPADLASAIEEAVDNGDMDYDGIIIRNVDDTGSYYKGEGKNVATDYIVFNSNQFKNADNTKPTADKDIRFSLSEAVEETSSKSYAEITEEQQALNQRENSLRERKREASNNPELLQAMDDYADLFTEMRSLLPKRHQGTATQAELDRIEEIKALREERMKRVSDLQESLGLNEIAKEEAEIRETKEALRLAADAAWEREGAEKENKAIEKAGVPAAEYFRKKALKAFKTTTNFNEAGYMLPDGKLLNFSGGERNHRYRDHREIGEIYEATNGTAALNRFLNDGNIRIMAESPGIDLASGVEPTKEQYAALRRFININGVADGQFFVDFSGAKGENIGKYQYNGRIVAERVVNDIKYFYQNGKLRESSGLLDFLSLSNVGEQPQRYGSFYTPATELRYEAPVQEEAAPVAETVSETESVAPVVISKNETTTNVTPEEMQELFPDDLAPAQTELDNLIQQKEALESRMLEMGNTEDFTDFEQVNAEYISVTDRIAELENEIGESEADRVDSLSDADAPPESKAVRGYKAVTAENPFADRSETAVGNRSVKAYQYENPEVKPFFREAAYALAEDIDLSIPAERWYNDKVYYESGGEKGFGGNSRLTAKDVGDFKDQWKCSWDDLREAVNDIIEDNGKENNALSKRVEFLINDRLMHGYTNIRGERIEPNQAYLDFLKEKQINEYSKEAREAFFANADQYAPADIAPVAQAAAPTVKDVAPVKEAYEAIRPKSEKQPRLARATPAEQARAEANQKGFVKGQQVMEGFEQKTAYEPKTAQILMEEPKVEKKKSGAWSMFKDNFVDKGTIFETLSLKTGNRELQGRWKSIGRAESSAQWFMEHGNASTSSLKTIRDTVEKSGKTKQFYEYLYHLHNADRMNLEDRYTDVANKPVFGYDVTSEMSRKTAAKLEAANPEFKQWSKEVYDYMTYLREMMVDNGVISNETAKLWAEMYPHYVPVRRKGDDGLNINVALDTRRTGVNAPVKKATGGNRDILPLFDTMAMRTEQTFKAVARNRFGVELKNMLGTTIENEMVDIDEAIDSVETELLQEGKDGRNPTFTVFENGEKVTFEITDEMYDTMKPKSKAMGYTNKALNTANNIRRGLLTEYNPAFMLTNPIKDTQDVLMNSQHPAKTYANYPKAIAELIGKKGQYYQEYMEHGGEMNTYFDGDAKTFVKEKSGLSKAIGFPLEKISQANNFIERIPRMAEYIASRKEGRSIDVSMLDAARVTTDFSAGGDLVKWMNRNGFTFLNASVQGAVQQVRNVREAKAEGLKGWAKLAAKVAAAGLPAMLLNHLLWDDDEEYDELSDYVKQNYYIVGKYGDGKFVRIPKGRTLAVIQDAFQQMENLVTGNDEVDLEAFADLVISNLAPSNPLENNLIAPIMQAMKNTTWYGDDLVPTRLQDLPAAEQFDETTDSISKWLGEKLDISPYKINYVLDQYSGAIGDMFLPMLTPEAERGSNTLIAPIMDKFTTDSVMKNQNVSDFYDKKDELTTNAKGSGATAEDILMNKYMNSINAELSALYAEKRRIQSTDMSDAEKYEAVRDIQKQIVDLTREGLATYDDIDYQTARDGEYANIGNRYFKLDEDGEWQKLSTEQATKYKVTSAAGYSNYASDGTNHYRWYEPGEDAGADAEAGWRKLTDKELEKQNKVTRSLGVSPEEYWNNKDEYSYAYENPGKYAVSKAVSSDFSGFTKLNSEINDIKDKNDSDSGTKDKDLVTDYIFGLDLDYGQKIILYRSMYSSKQDKAKYNRDIVKYLNSRDDISYEEMVAILKELDFTVHSNGTVTWD